MVSNFISFFLVVVCCSVINECFSQNEISGEQNEITSKREKIIPVMSKNSEYLLNEAILFFKNQQFSMAFNLLDSALKINCNPTLTDILFYYKGITLIKLDKRKDALEMIDSAIVLKPEKINYTYLKALTLFEMGEEREALNIYLKIAASEKNNTDLLIKIAFLYHNLGETDKALKYYSESISLNPNLYEAYYRRALLYLELLLHDKACTDISIALKGNHRAASDLQKKYCD